MSPHPAKLRIMVEKIAHGSFKVVKEELEYTISKYDFLQFYLTKGGMSIICIIITFVSQPLKQTQNREQCICLFACNGTHLWCALTPKDVSSIYQKKN